jgi:GT2 family glycosyltransferase
MGWIFGVRMISIVMAYYNRRRLLINTLRSIKKSSFKEDIEIIIVDDDSNEYNNISDVPSMFDFKIRIINVENKTWINPCIPLNIGIKEALGDIVIIQNPECYHIGNIIDDVSCRIKCNDYLVYACYSIDQFKTKKFDNDRVACIIPTSSVNVGDEPSMNRWFQHSEYNPANFNFCVAIMREDLLSLGGFDENYANGIAKDDKEFLHRVNKKGMHIYQIDVPYVVHQWHKQVIYDPYLVSINTALFNSIDDKNYKMKSRLLLT